MRVPFPERFQWKYVVLFALILLIVQLAEGTNVVFAGLMSAYILLWAAAFNVAGGVNHPSGSFVFFTGVLVVLFGAVYKAFLGEPGDKHLVAPVATMLVYCGGMCSLWVASAATRRFAPRTGWLSKAIPEGQMLRTATICFFFGSGLQLVFGAETASTGSIGSAIRQLNHLPVLGLLLATVYEVKRSNGQRGFNWLVTVAISFTFYGGVVWASKEGMFLGPMTWLLAAWSSGYNFRLKGVILGGCFLWFMLYFMVPYSQYVRNFRDSGGSTTANQQVAKEYIFKLNEVRAMDKEYSDEDAYAELPHFYDHPQGLVDRLSMFPPDDKLISLTNEGNVFGLYPLFHGYMNLIPRFLWPGKPDFFTGNVFGQEIGVLSEGDTLTGIAFSSVADAYHEAMWLGVFFFFPLVTFMYFIATDSVAGSVREGPWALLPIALNMHIAPEGTMDELVAQMVYGVVGLLILGWIVRYFFPAIMKVLTRGGADSVRRTTDFQLGSVPLAVGPAVLPQAETHS